MWKKLDTKTELAILPSKLFADGKQEQEVVPVEVFVCDTGEIRLFAPIIVARRGSLTILQELNGE